MALPVFRATGTVAVAIGGGTVAPADPAGIATGDLDIMVAMVPAGITLSITADGGGAWTAMTGTPVTETGARSLYVWSRTRVGGDGAPTVTASANGIKAAVRLAYQTGTFDTSDPFEIETTGTEATVDDSFSFAPGTSTTGADRLVLVVSTILRDSNTPSVPVCTNANLTALASRSDFCTASGAGGGWGITEGALAAAGAVGTFATTYLATSAKAYISFAIKPTTGTTANAGVATATGTANAASVSLAPGTGDAGATGAAGGPTSTVTPTAGAGTATGAANNATVTISAGTGVAGATGSAGGPTSTVAPVPTTASATGTALDATAITSGNTTASAGAATGSGAAFNAQLSLAPGTGVAGATGAAGGPTSTVAPTAGVASGVGAAFDATAIIVFAGAAGSATLSTLVDRAILDVLAASAGVSAAVDSATVSADGTGRATTSVRRSHAIIG